MLKKILMSRIGILLFSLAIPYQVIPQEDRIVQVAIDTFRSHVRLPPGSEIKFLVTL